MSKGLAIRGYDFVEFYVGSAKMVAYWYAKALGMDITAYLGPETGVRDRVSYYLTKNNVKFVVTSPVQPGCYDVYGFLQQHGDGVKRWSVEVDDVDEAFRYATANGAVMVYRPVKLEDHHGYVEQAAIRLYDDTELVYINRDNYDYLFKPKYCEPPVKLNIETIDTGIQQIDHIVGNVRENEMNLWADYFNKTMNFETFVDFKAGDIGTKYSALLSKVVRTRDSKIRNPINEPFEGLKKSQIEEYIEQYHGSGVQHIAIATDDIISTIDALRRNGVEFLRVPDTYYDMLRKRADLNINESIEDLQRLGILCDLEGDGYLLQLFTKPTGDRPTFFFEFIQRTGNSQGFGKGNFQALFESIELDQQLRGNLERDPSEVMPPC
ncbi:MAG: 4-hydroxyphenylpyruvate dioxygenase [candidate division Zixibacteria bacterium]|jgi:4-hydroxyphenylpyruvate dioxygenase|nr:4-hydroxyphenylpyruvate dioxygenase [candidate division Zixibacteria bacterium]